MVITQKDTSAHQRMALMVIGRHDLDIQTSSLLRFDVLDKKMDARGCAADIPKYLDGC